MFQVTAVALKTAAATTAAVAAVVAPVVRKEMDAQQGQGAARANHTKMPKIAMMKVKKKWR